MLHRWLWSLILAGTFVQTATALPPVMNGPLGATAAGQGGFGTIKGRLVWRGNDVPQPKVLVPKGHPGIKDPTICAANEPIMDRSLVVDPKTRGIRYGVVYLPKPSGANPELVKALAAKPAVVAMKDCEFVPYVLALHQGQALWFSSLDPVAHNARLGSTQAPALNRMLGPFGTFETRLRADRRAIPLACDIHAWTKAWVMVFDHPFFDVTREDGSFEIAGVPAGDQDLAVWHETMDRGGPGPVGKPGVRVCAGGVTDVGDILVPQ